MKILITNRANLKLKSFVTLVETEISGMAKSTINEDKDIIITDFMIFDQVVTGASTIISDESQAKFLNELMKNDEDPAIWNIWWHSHCDMGVFWSATDDKTIEEHTSQSYLISLVVNKKMEMKARLDIYPKDNSPFKQATYCKFDIDEIEIIASTTEAKRKERYEKELQKIEKEFEKRIAVVDKKYEDKDIKNITTLCKQEIDAKVKEKVYETTVYNHNQDCFHFNKQHDYSKGWKPTKKWNWFEGIIVDLDDLQNGIDDGDWFNKQSRAIGFNY